MTDRIRYLTITLDHDFRDDDVEVVVNAIKMIRGIAHVQNGVPVDMTDHLARQVVRAQFQHELMNAVIEVFRDKYKDSSK